MFASYPGASAKPKQTTPCSSCAASGPSCDSVHGLRGRYCCERCTGEHQEARDGAE